MLLRKYAKKNLAVVQASNSLGLILISISLIMNQFVTGIYLIDFLEGFFMGISIPLLLVGIYYASRARREAKDKTKEENKNC